MNPAALKGYGFASLMTVIFCIHYVVAKQVLPVVDPLSLGAVRGVGGGLLLALLFFRDVRASLNGAVVKKAFIIGFFTFGLNQVLFLHGLHLSTPTNAAVLSNLIPIVTLVFAALAGLEVWSTRATLGCVVGFITIAGYFSYLFTIDLWSYLHGNALIVLSVFSLCFGLILIKKWGEEIPHHVLSALMLTAGGLMLTAVSLDKIGGVFSYAAMGPWQFSAIIFEVVISTAVAYLANIMAFKYLPASTTMTFAYFQPVITAGLALIVFGTYPSMALLIVFAGALLANILVRKPSRL